MQDERDQLDRVLDSALATYADPGPESGLERRILGHIANEAAPAPRPRWLAWAIALPVAAGLLIFAVLAGPRLVHAPSSIPPQTRILQKPPALGGLAGNRALQSEGSDKDASGAKGRIESIAPANQSSPDAEMQPRRAVLETKSAPLPKLDVFPTPQPLTRQEQAFALHAARMTLPKRRAIARFQQSVFALTLTSAPRLAVTSIPTLSVASVPTLSLPDTVLLGPPVAVEN